MHRVTQLSKVIFEKLAILFSIGILLFLTGCSFDDSSSNLGGRIRRHAQQANNLEMNYTTASLHNVMVMTGMDQPFAAELRLVTVGVLDTFNLGPYADIHTAHKMYAGSAEPLNPENQDSNSTLLIKKEKATLHITRHGTLVSSIVGSKGRYGSASPGIAPGVVIYRMNIATYTLPTSSDNLYINVRHHGILSNGLEEFNRNNPQGLPVAINISMTGSFPQVQTAKKLGIVIVAAAGNNPDSSVVYPAKYAASIDQLIAGKPWVVVAAMASVLPKETPLPSDNYYAKKNFEGYFVANNTRYHLVNTGTSCRRASVYCFTIPIHNLYGFQITQVRYATEKPSLYGSRGIEVVLSDGNKYHAYGSSFSAPVVTAAMAYLKAKWPAAASDLLMNRLLLTSTLVGKRLTEAHTSLAEISTATESLAGSDIITQMILDPYLDEVVRIRYHEHFGRGVINVALALQPICLDFDAGCTFANPKSAAVLSPTMSLAVKTLVKTDLTAMPVTDDLGFYFTVNLEEKIQWQEPEPPKLSHIMTLLRVEMDQSRIYFNDNIWSFRISDNFSMIANLGELIPQATSKLQQRLFATSLAALYPYQVVLKQGKALHLRYGSTAQMFLLGGGVTIADSTNNYSGYLTLTVGSELFRIAYSNSYVQEDKELFGSKFSGVFGKVKTTKHFYHNLEFSLHLRKEFSFFVAFGQAIIKPEFESASLILPPFQDLTYRYFSVGLGKERVISRYDSFSVAFVSPITLYNKDTERMLRSLRNVPWRLDLTYRYKTPNHGLLSIFMNIRSGINKKYHYAGGFALLLKL